MPTSTAQADTSVLDGARNLLQGLRTEAGRTVARARNGVRMATGQVAAPATGVTPYDVVWRHGRARLLHYRNDDVRYSTPLLLIYSLANRPYIFDLAPGNSFVERLCDEGMDVYLLDWGVPDERDATNTLHTYAVEGIGDAIGAVLRESGHHEVNLYGYCLGGLLTLLGCAANPQWPVRSLMTAAVPLDMSKMFSGPTRMIRDGYVEIDHVFDENGNLPGSMVAQSFSTLEPLTWVTRYANLVEGMWSEEFLQAHQLMTGWGDDHVPMAGAAVREIAEKLVRSDSLPTRGEVEIGGRRVRLTDITVPYRSFVADGDTIVPPAASAAAPNLVGSADSAEIRVPGGHIGLMVGRQAHKRSVPLLIEFIKSRSEEVTSDIDHELVLAATAG